ncbi:CASP 1F2 [Olea europaea subsp. europaea]|uniref:CASP-like protein n=1 Tax=Olea europaea subsp. europaea TaxID=158383 RepID=A0A8S0TDJ1_OLEEU|nr:CASP 1F2 [Olea europaea subsp. europaea]
MENTVSQSLHKTHKLSFASQILLRVLATGGSLAATWLVLTSKQTVEVFGIVVDARYSYSSAFKFFAFANIISCAFSLLSFFIVFILGYKAVNPRNYFFIFLHDLILTTLLMAGCAAATAIGYVGKYGNSHTGWIAICDHFAKYCDRIMLSIIISFICILFYLLLTVISANVSRKS